MKLRDTIIYPKEGTVICLHVFVPSMKHRIRFPESLLPTVCVRYSSSNFDGMKVYEKVEMLGQSSLEMLDAPLSGTSGNAQVVMLTSDPIKVWSYLENPPHIDTTTSDSLKHVLQEVLARYDVSQANQSRRIMFDRKAAIDRTRNKTIERPLKAKRK